MKTNKNEITYSAMINAYRLNYEYNKALKLFFKILNNKCIKLNEKIYAIGLYCCGNACNKYKIW